MVVPIPIGTERRTRSWPFVTLLLLAANVAAFVWSFFFAKPEIVFDQFALVPAAWSVRTLVTSMFLHADVWHLFGNMLFLVVAGEQVEDRLGHLRFPLFYLACGIAGGVVHMLVTTGEAAHVPCVGASGAISGLMGAFLVFFPGERIRFLYWFFVFKAVIRVPAWQVIPFWVGTQALLAWETMNGHVTGVAVFAHLGGFAFGLAFAIAFRLFLSGRNRDARE